ncbi:DUF6630 family protein [Paenibacillus riograndensis]|uniref:DUF6630 domain-containing protein n=1 Tax=Paenibacillus riograndensis SBR5 TaxID=1073571 RepID=A0A0E4HAF2_9BACL|nr:hypothetical protein [Paenibacillus riograndensis]CQR55771.1 hypothetical protein PRIO_3368 [Paenibacillus riograndensis SBR5]
MFDEGVLQLLFEDRKDIEAILDDPEAFNLYESMLKYGLSTQKFLYLDYRGEQDNEMVNYILDYEFARGIEVASQDELEELGEFEYAFLPEKVREANKLLSQKGYGLFSFPTSGDFYVLFITKLESKTRLLQTEILADEELPSSERFIKYYY